MRIHEALGVLKDASEFTGMELESALTRSGLGKRSKQRFLKSSSTDDTIQKRTRGAGGNTNTFKCFIIQQSAVPTEIMELLSKGN